MVMHQSPPTASLLAPHGGAPFLGPEGNPERAGGPLKLWVAARCPRRQPPTCGCLSVLAQYKPGRYKPGRNPARALSSEPGHFEHAAGPTSLCMISRPLNWIENLI
eukprot:scaffold105361_cov27-Phaeocystis_antarctica.AAC.1